MGELSPWHLLIVAAVFVLLFGAKRLPDAARSVGKSLRIFKTEVKGLRDDEEQATAQRAQVTQTAAIPQTPQDAPAIAPVVPPTTPTASDPTSPR